MGTVPGEKDMAIVRTDSKGRNVKRWNRYVAVGVTAVTVAGGFLFLDGDHGGGLAVMVVANCLANVWLLVTK